MGCADGCILALTIGVLGFLSLTTDLYSSMTESMALVYEFLDLPAKVYPFGPERIRRQH